MVIAPARTGRESRSKIAVILTAQTNRDIRSRDIPFGRILVTVEIKLMAPKIEEIPAIWRLKIAKSTEAPSWAILEDRGG
jgi:hypothetical protein